MPSVRVLLFVAAVSGAMTLHIGAVGQAETITRRFTPADQETGRYQYVPFQVPAGAGVLRVAYEYDRANGENVVDLGVFEPGPLDLGTAAFRGYSGGSKGGFTIGPVRATPGYRPGALPSGTWHVLLGLYRVREAGVEVTLRIETGPADNVSPSAPAPTIAAAASDSDQQAARPGAPDGSPQRAGVRAGDPEGGSTAKWYMGAVHIHTEHSDGIVGMAEMKRLTRAAGFDFVAITDHNNTTHTHDLSPEDADGGRPLLITGEEVTTPGGHANVWGLKPGGWVDFRVKAGDTRIAEIVAAARRQGGLFSINHPTSTCVGCGWDHAVVDGIEAVEISNGRHGEVDRALDFWDMLLRTGRRITGVGSSDWHGPPNPMDVANVRVLASALTPDAVLAAIRAGHVIVTNGARYSTPHISARAGATTAGIGESFAVSEGTQVTVVIDAADLTFGRVHVIGNRHAARVVPLDERGAARLEWPAQHGYVRFELYAQDESPVAYTNPIYFVPR